MRFCPRCGKKGIKGEFCSECTEKELGLSFKDITIKKCINCNRFMVQHKWEPFDIPDQGIVKAVYSRIKNPKKFVLDIIPHYEIALKNKPGAEQDIELEVSAEEQEFVIPAKILFTTCPRCSTEGTEYFEGVLQLRNASPELIKFVKDDLHHHKKEGVHITKETSNGGDMDLILTSAKYLRRLGKLLAQRFNGELTEAARLFSNDKYTGKDIYRISVLFKMRKHKIGDIVEHRGRKIKIKTLGKHVSGIDVETGKTVMVKE